MLAKIEDLNQNFDDFLTKQVKLEDKFCLLTRRQNGIFFTKSSSVIDAVLDCLPNDQSLLSKTILEPSCGQGAFLLRILIKVYIICQNETVVKEFIENRLYFVDIDPQMIEQTKNNLSELYMTIFNKSFDGKFNSYCLDFTLVKPDLDLFSNGFLDFYNMYGEFDYIVGNPPYITLYGRRDKKKNETQRIYYLNNYDQFPYEVKNGKINYIMLFIEHGIKFLKPTGTLSFIVDTSFLETAYKYCRKYIIQNYILRSFIYNIKSFEDVVSGQIILVIDKINPKLHEIKVINSEDNSIYYIPQSHWNSPDDEFQFRLPNCSDLTDIVNKIFLKQDPTLKDLYPKKNLRTCTMLLDMEDIFTGISPLHHTEEIKSYPYYRGSTGVKYKYSKPRHEKYFYYDKCLQDKINNKLKEELTVQGIKNKKRIGLGETVIYDNPKVYIRQSAKELIATFDPNPSAANNSLYVFSLRDGNNESVFFLKYLCGLINSSIYTFFAQQRRIIRYNTGKQPQIKTSDLYKIFIPSKYEIQKKIVMLVDEIYEKPKFCGTSKSEIDKILFNYYQLDSEQITLVQKSIESFGG